MKFSNKTIRMVDFGLQLNGFIEITKYFCLHFNLPRKKLTAIRTLYKR